MIFASDIFIIIQYTVYLYWSIYLHFTLTVK